MEQNSKENLILRRLPPIEGRTFVVGDVHGCFDLLMLELEKVEFSFTEDRLIGVGDLIDRSTQNIEMLELLYEPFFFSIRGNHEEMMFNAVLDGDIPSYQCWMQNGGLWALDYVASQDSWDDGFHTLVKDASTRMPLAYEIPVGDKVYGILHAEPPEFWTEENIRDERFATLWSRYLFDIGVEMVVKGVDHVYVGHTPVEDGPITRGNITYLDTGANWTGKLTVVELKE